MFAYCDSNPVNGYGDEGTLSQTNIARLAVGTLLLAGAIANNLKLELYVRPATQIAKTVIEAGWEIN